MKKNFILFLFIVVLFSCRSVQKKEANNYKYSLVKADSIKINLQDTIPYPPASSYAWNYNDKYLAFLFSATRFSGPIRLYYYNFIKKKWKLTLLNSIGPNGIKSEGSFAFLNDTTLFYDPAKVLERFFIVNNKSAKIIKTYRIKNLTYSIEYFSPFCVYSDSEYFVFPLTSNMATYRNLKNIKLIGIYNKNIQSLKPMVNYPPSFPVPELKESSAQFSSTVTIYKQTVVINFPKDPFLYSYNFKEDKFSKHLCENKGVYQVKKYSGDKRRNAFIDFLTGQYKNVVFDPFRKVFYRLSYSFPNFKNGNIAFDNKQEIKNIIKKRRFTVQILDTTLNVIGETSFTNLNGLYFFVTQKGFYVYKSSGSYDEHEELGFVNLKLVKRQE